MTRPLIQRATLPRLAALAIALTACTDAPTEARPVIEPTVAPVLALTCRASVHEQSVSCAAPGVTGASASGVSPSLVLGGQGVYVQLTSSNVAYDATAGVFSADVRVRNLTAQQMGTADGTTASGIKVFFQSGPSVVSGTGAVSVANPDGTGTFLAADQPYFAYPQMLEPLDSTSSRPWRFTVPATVDRFVFQVYVQAELPSERGVLRWVTSRSPLATTSLGGVWAASAADVFAVGDGGVIAHHDGTAWSRMSSPVTIGLTRVAGRSGSDVFAVGLGGILHWDGALWSKQLQSGLFHGVWVSQGTADVFAVGENGEARRYDGSGWVSTSTGTSSNLAGVWGASPTDVFAVGDGDVMLRWNGTSWSVGSTGTGENLTDVWGTSASDLWVSTESGALLHWNGSSWQTVATNGFSSLRAVTGGAGLLYAAGDQGSVLRWNGTAATVLPQPALTGVRGLSMLPSGVLVAVGDQGTIARWDGARWTVEENASGYTAVWGSRGSDVYAVNTAGLVSHFDGAAWTFVRAPVSASLRSVAGSGSSDVYVGGDDGVLLHFDGSTWSTTSARVPGALSVVALWSPAAGTLFAATAGDPNSDPFDPAARIVRYSGGSVAQSSAGFGARALWGPSATDAFAAGDSTEVARWNGSTWTTTLARSGFATLFGVWGSSASDVWAVGDFTIRHWNGSTWTATPAPGTQFKGVWGSSASDVFAVGDRGVVWHHNGTRWNPQFPGTAASLTAVWGTSPTDVYAVGSNGTLLHGTR